MSAHVDHEIVIRAPLSLTWKMANDVQSWPSLFAGEYAKVDLLSATHDRMVLRLFTVPDDHGRTFSWTSERVMDVDTHTVAARRLELGPFRYMHIFQSFEPTMTGTRLRWVQDFEMRADSPFGDQEMSDRIGRHAKVNLQKHQGAIERAMSLSSPIAG
jgi:aromatase